MGSRWLLVGAMGAETTPLLALLERPRPLSRRLILGRVGGQQVAVLTAGVGPGKAEARTREALALFAPDQVLNLGTCGALVDGLRRGDLVHVDRLLDHRGELGSVPALGQPAMTLVTVEQGVWDRATRAALAARGAQVCVGSPGTELEFAL